MKRTSGVIFLLLSLIINTTAQEFAIIPRPAEISPGKGAYILDESSSIQFDTNNSEIKRIARFFEEYVENVYGFSLSKNSSGKPIQLKLIRRLNLSDEGYLLKIKPGSIIITASKPNGLFYGIHLS